MKLFKDQCLSGTKLDAQGERIPKSVLESFAIGNTGVRQPLNQGHDLTLKTIGYIENIRLIKDTNDPKEWLLIGDVFCDPTDLEITLGGFSISYLELTHRSVVQEEFLVYLPFPHYNDDILLSELLESENISLGKWVKKAADPSTIALIGAVGVFVLTPVWDDLYKKFVAPRVYGFFSKNLDRFTKKNISTDFIQKISFDGLDIQVVLIPKRGKEKECFSVDNINDALESVHSYLFSTPLPTHKSISRLDLFYYSETVGFKMHRIEYDDGEVEHVV